jgi:hypothetical protein
VTLDFLQDAVHENEALAPPLLAKRLGVALAYGIAVAAVARLARRPREGGLSATVVLLTVLIALVTQVIGNSVARAFSLAGALAVVRFRAVMEDSRDTAFVVAAVALGMATGAGYLLAPLVALPFLAFGALVFRSSGRAPEVPPPEATLSLRLPLGRDPEAALREAFGRHLEGWRLTEAGTARQGAALDLTYTVRLRAEASAAGLVGELNGVEGVQAVTLRAR